MVAIVANTDPNHDWYAWNDVKRIFRTSGASSPLRRPTSN
jgi:hypothetical protein